MLLLTLLLINVLADTTDNNHLLQQGLQYHRQNKFSLALSTYQSVIQSNPSCADCHHLSGIIHLSQASTEAAIQSITTAIQLKPTVNNFHNTLGEVYRQSGRSKQAIQHYQEAIRLSLLQSIPNAEHYNNLGLVLMELGDSNAAIVQFENAIQIQSDHPAASHNLGLAYRNIGNTEKSIEIFLLLRNKESNDVDATFHLAISLQMAGKLVEAKKIYIEILNLANAAQQQQQQQQQQQIVNLIDPDRKAAIQVNLGAIYQESGDFIQAIELYNKVLEKKPNDSRALNNLGSSLWQLGYAERSVQTYKKAIQIDPSSPEPHVNLGVALYEYGDVIGAKEMYTQALKLGGTSGLHVRTAMLMKPIMISKDSILTTRRQFIENIQQLMKMTPKLIIDEPVKDVERLHFYLVYHGYNEYKNQVMMANLYLSSTPHLKWISPWLKNVNNNNNNNNRPGQTKIRVGFVSKFFVINHAHGQLLEGIVAHLPRDRFEIIICAIPNPQQLLLPSMVETADYVSRLSFNLKEARLQMSELKLDVLIFADMMSEPLTYFLGIGSRIAPIQCLFWGNPVTSGSENIDYFISGEHMEPSRSNPMSDNIQYSEQVLLLQGQGIWYDQIPIPAPLSVVEEKQVFDDDDWLWYRNDPSAVVYICPQSSFKLHPDFDMVLTRILKTVSNSHLILLKGRRDTWTKMVQNRMRSVMPPNVWKRVHFVKRVAGSDNFIRLIQKADVMLHPFPFGGSKTSADALAVGLPLVILVTDSLRGRMAYSYFVTMNVYDTVARSTIEYVNIATRLGHDTLWRSIVGRAIREKSHLIWERMSVVNAWSNFLNRAHRTYTINKQIETNLKRRKDWKEKTERKVVVLKSNTKGLSQTKSVHIKQMETTTESVSSPPGPNEKNQNQERLKKKKEVDINQLIKQARSDYERGDVINAQKMYELVLLNRPNDPRILNDFGAVLKQSNQLQLAKEMFSRATLSQPGYLVAHNNLGVVLQELGLFQDASREYTKVLDLNPTHSGAIYNLGNLYRDLGRDDKAQELLQRTLRLNYFGSDILCLLSLLDMSAMQDNYKIWNALDQSFKLNVSTSINLQIEISRLQTNYLDATNSLVKFFTQLDDAESSFVLKSKNIYNLVRKAIALEIDMYKPLESLDSVLPTQRQFHVIVQWYEASTSKRQSEIDECLLENLRNPNITHVHVLTERNITFSFHSILANKLIQTVVGKRLTFESAFNYANTVLKGQVCSIANADIYYDHSIVDLMQNMKPNTVYATLRWDAKTNASSILMPRIDSQDTWTFQSPVQVNGIDFEVGRLRSDNRIAAQLMASNYRVINNPFVFKTHHLQMTEKRPGRTNQEQIPGRTSNVIVECRILT